jgi:hypothetical protein
MGEDSFKRKTDEITYRLSNNPLVAKYLLVMVDQGMTSMVNNFNSLEEAEKALKKITNDLSANPYHRGVLIIKRSRYGNGQKANMKRFIYTYKKRYS